VEEQQMWLLDLPGAFHGEMTIKPLTGNLAILQPDNRVTQN
jgi:hypothetical protein